MTSQLTSAFSPVRVDAVRVVALKVLVSMVTVGVRPHGNVQLGEGVDDVGEREVVVAMANWVADDGRGVEVGDDPVHAVLHLLVEVHFDFSYKIFKFLTELCFPMLNRIYKF